MKKHLQRLLKYIFRTWEDEAKADPPSAVKLLPPFFYELLSYFLILALFYYIGYQLISYI